MLRKAIRMIPVTRLTRRGLVLGASAWLVAACSGGSAPTTYDLTAPRGVASSGRGGSYLAVSEPTTTQALDSERIIVRDAAGSISYLGGAQWADRLTRLVQTRVIQTFENAGRIGRVGRPGDRIVADWQLNLDIRAMTIDAGTGEAVVEITAKIVNDRTGRVAGAKLFTARQPASAIEGGAAARALDTALSQVMLDMVRWARV
jgi:cholesterol transport system auxiliary component